MSLVGQRERFTQDRVIDILSSQLGYEYAGDWKDRANSNVEEDLLRQNLLARVGLPANGGHVVELPHS